MLMEKYAPGEIKNILEHIGIKVINQSPTDYFCYCPFHNNTNTPSFAISKIKIGRAHV